MQKQLDAATRSQIKFPKTDEEVEAWSKRYPDVAKIVVDESVVKGDSEPLLVYETPSAAVSGADD